MADQATMTRRPRDVRLVLVGRAVRGAADGFVSVLLAQYLTNLGFSPVQVGALVAGTLVGSAVLTLSFGLTAHRTTLRTLLLAACGLMAATGLGFVAFTAFVPLLVVGIVGTLNPSGGDVSVFLPTEQAYVADRVDGKARPHLFAVYNLAGAFAGAFGALASGLPSFVARRLDLETVNVQRASFLLYVLAAVIIFFLYRGLLPGAQTSGRPAGALTSSRRIVMELAGLFSVDSAAGGLVGTSILVLWLHLRFDLSAGATGLVFFVAGLLSGFSQLIAPRLAARIGLIRTMSYTHLPANMLLALAAFAPYGWLAVGLLLVRAFFSQMDVPARQAFVMAVVPAAERPAASSVTNVPRSLAAASTPLLAGILLNHSTFGWPLLIAGVTKSCYDLTLLGLYRNVPEVEGAMRRRSPA
jgi:MFS family permease